MALVFNGHNDPPQPASPSLSNPDMILPYDPRLRDSGSTQHSGGPDIGSLNGQMAMTLDTSAGTSWPGAKHQSRPSMPGEWQTESDIHGATPTGEGPSGQSAASGPQPAQARLSPPYKTGTSFLNLDRYSTISAGSTGKSDSPKPPVPQDDLSKDPPTESEEELNARNDFARAEEILANAKKRLTTMENNLTRARSINVGRSPSAASNTPDESSPIGSRFQPRVNGWAVSAAKLRQANFSPGTVGTGHSRVFSENSIPKTNLELVKKVGEEERIRSSSAMGSLRAEDMPVEEHRAHLRGFGRLEPLKEDELLTPSEGSSHRATSRSGLDRLHDLPAKARSNVQLRDLRDQMEDLKGKLDTLKRRTREDSVRRSSMQYLKSPSPFTDAEAWTKSRSQSRQSESANSAARSGTPSAGGAAAAAAAATVAAPATHNDTDSAGALSPPGSMASGPRGVIEGALTSLDARLHGSPKKAPSHKPNLSGSLTFPKQEAVVEQSAFDPWSPSSERASLLGGEQLPQPQEQQPAADSAQPDPSDEETRAVEAAEAAATVDAADYASEPDDVQKDSSPIEASGSDSTPATELSGDAAAAPGLNDAAATNLPAELSHEERPDAFDYENFVISSTMGTYSRMGRRSRSTSRSSASTIGPDAFVDPATSPQPRTQSAARALHHTRHDSASSSSSIGTFATAASRSGSRLQGGSRAALREAASREALRQLPSYEAAAAAMYDDASTVSGPSSDYGSEEGHAPRAPRSRPLSTASFSRPRPVSTIFRGGPASKSAGARQSYVHGGGAGERGAQARSQILSVLLAEVPGGGAHEASRGTPALLHRISPADEALVRAVIEGMQRACGDLALADERDDPDHMDLVRRRLESARRALEGDGLEALEEDADEYESGEEREFLAL